MTEPSKELVARRGIHGLEEGRGPVVQHLGLDLELACQKVPHGSRHAEVAPGTARRDHLEKAVDSHRQGLGGRVLAEREREHCEAQVVPVNNQAAASEEANCPGYGKERHRWRVLNKDHGEGLSNAKAMPDWLSTLLAKYKSCDDDRLARENEEGAAVAAGATPTGKKKSLWAPGMACDSLGSFANFIAFCLFDRLETGLTLAELDSIRCVVEASDDGSDAALPFAHWRPIGTDDNADENVTQDGFDEKAASRGPLGCGRHR